MLIERLHLKLNTIYLAQPSPLLHLSLSLFVFLPLPLLPSPPQPNCTRLTEPWIYTRTHNPFDLYS